jgi:hypothetical protein
LTIIMNRIVGISFRFEFDQFLRRVLWNVTDLARELHRAGA